MGWLIRCGAVPAASTIIADVVPAERRGEGIVYFSLSPNKAMALAPAAGLALVASLGFVPLFIAPSVIAGLLTFTMAGVTTFVAIDAAHRLIGDSRRILSAVRDGVAGDPTGCGMGLLVLGGPAVPWTLPVAALLYGSGFGCSPRVWLLLRSDCSSRQANTTRND